VLLMLFYAFCTSVGLVITSFYGGNYRNLLCLNNVKSQQYAPAGCGAQGFFIHFGTLAYAITWACICIHSAVTVVLRRDVWNRWTMIATYVICIPLPFLLTGVIAGYQQITGNTTFPWCWQAASGTQAGGMIAAANMDYSLYEAPMGVALLIGLICLSVVLWASLRVSTGTYSLISNLRLIVFMICAMAVVVIEFAYRFFVTPNQNDLATSIAAWQNCSIVADTPPCTRGSYVNNALVWVLTVVVSCFGVVLVGLFASQRELWTDWGNKVAPWKNFGTLVLTNTTATTDASSSSSSSSSGESTFMSDLQ